MAGHEAHYADAISSGAASTHQHDELAPSQPGSSSGPEDETSDGGGVEDLAACVANDGDRHHHHRGIDGPVQLGARRSDGDGGGDDGVNVVAVGASAVDAAAAAAASADADPKAQAGAAHVEPTPAAFDIEHTPVDDDPRAWSPLRKSSNLAMVSAGAFIPTLAASVIFPAIQDLKRDLNATDTQVELSVSLYILFQGCFPLLWSPLSELVGRKRCFQCAMLLFSASTFVAAAASRDMATFIAMRIVAAAGSSAMLAIAAGTIADMYEPNQRGRAVAAYYSAPLVGPSLGPIFGGALTQAGSWRYSFYFLASCGSASFLGFVFFFRDTFRTERSVAWQKARREALARHAARSEEEEAKTAVGREADGGGVGGAEGVDDGGDGNGGDGREGEGRGWGRWRKVWPFGRRVQRDVERGGVPRARGHGKRISSTDRAREERHHARPPDGGDDVEPGVKEEAAHDDGNAAAPFVPPRYLGAGAGRTDEAGRVRTTATGRALSRAASAGWSQRVVTEQGEEIRFKPALKDVSPLRSASHVVRQPHNLAALLSSGLGFGSQYSLTYSATRTLTAEPYAYRPIVVGCCLLALGASGIAGSLLSGKLSDHRLQTVQARNAASASTAAAGEAGAATPTATATKPAAEERLRVASYLYLVTPLAFVSYAWCAEYRTNVAGELLSMVGVGFSVFWVYSCTLSYVVDSNVGYSAGAVACNSATRGVVACVASQVAGPLQDSWGDGALYTAWAVLLALGELALAWAGWRGRWWRDEEWAGPRWDEWGTMLKGGRRERGAQAIRERRRREEQQQKQEKQQQERQQRGQREPKAG